MTFQPGSPRSPSASSAVHSSGRRRSRRLTVLAGLLTLAAGLLAAAAPAASAAAHAAPAAKATTTDGWIRLAHLSPNTPPVDVYLSSSTGSVHHQPEPFRRSSAGTGHEAGHRRLPECREQAQSRREG
jgi:hypothetical protein